MLTPRARAGSTAAATEALNKGPSTRKAPSCSANSAAARAPSGVPPVSLGSSTRRASATSNRASCAASSIAAPISSWAPLSGSSSATLIGGGASSAGGDSNGANGSTVTGVSAATGGGLGAGAGCGAAGATGTGVGAESGGGTRRVTSVGGALAGAASPPIPRRPLMSRVGDPHPASSARLAANKVVVSDIGTGRFCNARPVHSPGAYGTENKR